MDISRSVLDNLMGRDRNFPKDSAQSRDHYSNSDVCKPFLICFCFNTLFPNTIYDEGPCNKRHDTYLKTMFDNDLNRCQYEKVYIKECIAWIERRLQEVEQKTRKNLSTIESKTSLSTQRPRQLLDRILAIDKDIEEMMRQAAIFGENGQIDDSSRCLEEVQRLREHRKEVDLMGDNILAVIKHQKICDVCGAIQTINDTEKRIQMHLQGKIHQGFLRLRTEIETLKIRLEIVQQKLEKIREKNPQQAITAEPSQPIESKPIEKPFEQQKEKQGRQSRQNREKERIEQQSPNKKKKKQHKHKEERSSRQKKRREHSQERPSGDKERYDKYERSRSKDKHRKQKKQKDKKKKQEKRSRSHEREHRKYYD